MVSEGAFLRALSELFFGGAWPDDQMGSDRHAL